MDTFEFSPDHFDQKNIHAGDDKLPVKFHFEAIKDEDATLKEGRPIYRDVECVMIYKSRNDVVNRPVRDEDKQRWPRAYAAWKNSGESDPGAIGTRLEHWPQMTRSQAEEYRYFKVFTVEQLAEMSDVNCQKIVGSLKLRQLARLYVEASKGEQVFAKMQSELEKRDGQIAELQAEVRRLTAMITEKLQPA